MAEDLVLQHPHVHEWRLAVPWGLQRVKQVWLGPVLGEGVPPVSCECGEDAGDWSDVNVYVDVSGSFDLKVSDIWPDGDHPVPVTAEAVATALERMGSRRRVLGDFGFDDLSTTVGIGSDTADVWDPFAKRV